MNNADEKRCKKCGKIIPLYKKIPICKRCSLEVRNIGGQGGIAFLAVAAIKQLGDDKK